MFQGSLVALITPMKANGDVDKKALHGLIDWHVAAGTHGIVSVGTTGESATLDFDEHHQVIEETIKRVDGRIPVIAGTGANATKEAVELTRFGKDVGADGTLLVTPYYNKPTQEGLYRHYLEIASHVDIPMILYNVPPRTACDMSAETVVRIAKEVDHVVGLKEACGDANRIVEVRKLLGNSRDDFCIYSGDDGLTLEMFELGGPGAMNGVITVTANVFPELMSNFCNSLLAGDRETAREIDATLQPIHKILFCETSPIPTKWALNHLGRIDSGIRLPLVPLSDQFHEPMREQLEKIAANGE